jgi:uncharacterized membrane protein YoaK (UPF0700 family)
MINRLTTLREAILMILTASSGAVDAICFISFSKVFTAFMTGNLVFLGIGAAGAFKPGGPSLLRVGVVIVAFMVGVFVAARINKRVKGSRGIALSLAFALVGVFFLQLVFLGGWISASGDPSDAFATALAGIEAVAMGMQSSAIGSLDVKGVFTTAATATLLYFSRGAADRQASDPDPARMARILVCLIVGALAGGLLLVHARTYAPVLPAVATAAAIALTLAAHRRSRRDASTSSLVAVDGDAGDAGEAVGPVIQGDPAVGEAA